MVDFHIGHVYTFVRGTEHEYEALSYLLRYFDQASKYTQTPDWMKSQYKFLVYDSTDTGDYKFKFFSGLAPWVKEQIERREGEVTITEDSSNVFKHGPMFTPPVDYLTGIELRDYQIHAARKAIYQMRGILQMPARSGKTATATAIIKFFDKKTLLVVNSQFLFSQTYDSLKAFGLENVGRIGEGKNEPAKVTVATIQSLDSRLRKGDPDTYRCVKSAEILIFDEVHHLKAEGQWMPVGAACNAPIRLGLSATPFIYQNRSVSFEDHALTGLTGDVIVNLTPNALIRRGYLAKPRVFFVPIRRPQVEIPKGMAKNKRWHHVYKTGITENEFRNRIFMNVAVKMYEAGLRVLVLVSQKKHGLTLLNMLRGKIPNGHCIFSKGGRVVHELTPSGTISGKWPFSLVRSFIESNEKVIVVGTTVYDEGVDLPSLDAVIILSAQKKYRVVVQRAGRPLTPQEGKDEAWIIDAFDTTHFWLERQATERKKTLEVVYENIEITVDGKKLLDAIEKRRLQYGPDSI